MTQLNYRHTVEVDVYQRDYTIIDSLEETYFYVWDYRTARDKRNPTEVFHRLFSRIAKCLKRLNK